MMNIMAMSIWSQEIAPAVILSEVNTILYILEICLMTAFSHIYLFVYVVVYLNMS